MHAPMLRRLTKPALFITGTDTGVGKSVVASAIADRLHRTSGLRVGAIKPVASGCDAGGGRIVNEDAERLSAAIGGRFPLEVVCPQQYRSQLTPAVAARVEGRPLDWTAIARAFEIIEADSDVLIVEGAGGLFAPLDDERCVLDVMRMLGAPAVCISRPTLGTINHTAMTVDTMRCHDVACCGVIVNRYPAAPGLTERTNLEEIARWAKVPIRCVVPEAYFVGYDTPAEVARAVATVDWLSLCGTALH